MINRAAIAIGTLVLFSLSAFSQTTGTPPFSSISGGPDAINLATLNAHYSMPVFGRNGRGIPLSFGLAVDSSVWTLLPPVYPSTLSTWVHSPTWGRSFGAIPASGAVFYTVTQLTCHDPNGNYPYNQYTAQSYLDVGNTSHSFNVRVYDDPCTTNKPYTATGLSTDGSNATLTFSASPTATLATQDGEVIQPLVMDSAMNVAGGPTYTRTDSNGNRITINARAARNFLLTSVVDTLGTTGVSSTGTPPSAVNYTYTSPSGASASVVATYVTKNVQLAYGCSNATGYGPQSNTLLDRITLPDGSYYQFTYEPTTTGSGNVTARIASVRLPTGGTITYAYVGGDTNRGIFCTDGTTAGFNRITPDGTWQYRRTVGTGTSTTTTVTDPQGKATVVSFSGNYETQRLVYDGAVGGTLLSSVVTCYNGETNPSVCPTATVPLPPFTQVTTLRSLNGGPWAQTDVKYTNGLVTETDEYDFGVSTPTRKTLITYDATLGNNILDKPSTVQVVDGSGNLQSRTDYVYDEDQGSLQTSGAAQRVAVTCTTGFTKCRGNVTTLKRYKTSSATLNQTFTHYDTGQVYQATDSNGAVTTNTYGACGNSLLTTVSMPLSLSRSSTWNCTGGVVTSSTDENGKISYVNYTTDHYFWRPESAKDPLLNIANFSYPSLVQTERYLNFNGTTSTVDVVTSLDSLGRTQYSQTKQGPGSSTYDSVRQTYDSLGRPYTLSNPYAGAKGSPPSGGSATTTVYDGMGRATQIVDGGGGTANITYTQNDVYTEAAPAPSVPPAPAAENTKRKQLQYDGLGRLTSVCEVTSEATYSGSCGQTVAQTGYLTNYAYDISPNFNSLTVTQSAQRGTAQTRKYVYDMLGRLTSETNPETANLAFTYTYDSDSTCGTYQGDLVKRTDAKGNVTCYAYDVLHRVTSVTYPSGPNSANTAKKYFVYDAATVNGQVMANPKGRLAEAYTCTTCPGTKITDLGFSYSGRGEATDVYESTTHSGGYYHLTASYWAHGALNALSGVPGLPTMYYGASDGSGLDGEGRVTKVTASSGQNPVTGVTYTTSGTTQPIGSLTQVTLGSGDNDTFGYDVNTGRLTQYKFNIGATPQTVEGDLTWNANGTLAKLVIADPFNSANAQTCTFGYDDLARAKSVACGTAWNQTFSLDPFGNLSKSGTITFQPGFDQTKNWFLPVTGFDNNGNLLSDTTHTYSWDAENKLTAVDTVSLTFDALGRMVEQARGSSYTQIVYAPTGARLALVNGQTLQKSFVPLPGGGTAVYTSAGLAYYRHTDWLGSSRFASTPATRTKYFDVAYAPYGEDYADSGTTDLDFTGQNQDTVSGLYDFMYREYHPNSGRWIQPDPAGLVASDPSNPQSWNRYAYLANGPLNAVDPLGLFNDALGSKQDDGCYLTFSCTVYVDQLGMAYDNSFAQALLHMGAATTGPFPGPGYASSAGGLVHQYSDGSETLLSPEDVTELGFSSQPQGLTANKIDPMYCAPNVIGAMKKSWSMTTNGTSHNEASFFVLSSAGGGFNTTTPLSSYEYNKNTVNWVTGAIAFGHVHPNGTTAWPTPGKDTQYAGSPWNVTVFTFGSGGLWEFRSGYKRSLEIRKGLDWTKPCK